MLFSNNKGLQNLLDEYDYYSFLFITISQRIVINKNT